MPRIVVEPAAKWAAFRTARAALAASGTVTLELALAGVPTVAAYWLPLIEEIMALRSMGFRGTLHSVILANLVLGENDVPEFLQRDCTPQRLADALSRFCPTPRSVGGRSRPSAGSIASWRPPPRRRAPRPRQSCSMWRAMAAAISPPPAAEIKGLLSAMRYPWLNPPLTRARYSSDPIGSAAHDQTAQTAEIRDPRRDHRGARLRAAGRAHQCRAGADGRHQRRMDRRAHRNQGTAYPQGQGPRHARIWAPRPCAVF